VLKTPASFNTPLGIARTVNDSYDGQDHFVVEMGAYRRGEIERLCRLVGGTDVSVITTVNAQHLERFGSLEATAEAKFEIVEGLRRGGTAVLNFDVAAVRERAGLLRGAQEAGSPHPPAPSPGEERGSQGLRFAKAEEVNVLSFGVEWEDVGLRGANVVETRTGIEMDVTWGGETVHVAPRLLARHNATNVLAAMGVGLACGLELGYMAAAIGRFEPPEHRLRPQELSNGVTLLDDGYNANPEGIIGALEVLGSYAPRRRVLVTSGLIEMGREKAAYHARIGKAAAKYADVAVLVGPKQTSDIRAAMLEAGFAAERVHVARNPEDAESVLGRIGEAGDVVLHSTDLPDQFDEYLVI
jgi:UDP-N-acetylmuramoyl-tripeptide--D-alanyl-D-alanine ligase